MKPTVLLMLAALTLGGCGTLQGLLEGTGRAVEGVAQDLRGAGGMFQR